MKCFRYHRKLFSTEYNYMQLSRLTDMWKHLLACSVLACAVDGLFNKFISKGKWVVDRIERCPDDDRYPFKIDLHKRKVNRTHDVFYGELELLEDITADQIAVSIEACKQVVGGCRPVATLGGDSFCQFLHQYAEENFKRFLGNIGVAEDCPVPKGLYKLNNFLFDNTEIADDGMVGEFVGIGTVLKQDVAMACVAMHLHFAQSDDDND